MTQLQKNERRALWHAVDCLKLMLREGKELMTPEQIASEQARLDLAKRALRKLYAKEAA